MDLNWDFTEGLRARDYAARNKPGLTMLQNMKATPEGLVPWDNAFNDLPASLITNLIAAGELTVGGEPVYFGFPLIYFGREFAVVVGRTTIYSVNLGSWALTAQTVYDNLTGNSTTIPAGGVWQAADFGPVLFLFNGECVLVRVSRWTNGELGSATWYCDTTAVPATGANIRGRLVLGGFKTAGTTHGSLIGALYALSKSDLGLGSTYPALTQYGQQAVWWSSISAEDMFQFFFPDQLVHMPDILQTNPNTLTDGGFADATKWTLSGGGPTIGAGVLSFAATSGTATQAGATQAYPLEVGKAYRVRYTIPTLSAGSIKVKLGTTSGATRTSPGTYTEYLVCAGNTIFTIEGAASTTATVDNVFVYEADLTLLEEVWLRNEGGSKSTPWLGSVLRVEKLGDGALVLTKGGVGMLRPAAGGQFGWFGVAHTGCQGRGAVAGDESRLTWMDKEGVIWDVGVDGIARRLGFEEFAATMVPYTVQGAFDPNRREVFFGTDLGGSVAYGVGLSENGQAFVTRGAVSSLTRYLGLSYALVFRVGEDTTLRAQTEVVDFGGREAGTLEGAEIAYAGTGLQWRISRRFNPANGMEAVDTVDVDNRGSIRRATTGTEFQFELRASDYSTVEKVDYLKVFYRPGGRKSLRDLG